MDLGKPKVLDGDPELYAVSCAKMAVPVPIQMQYGMLSWVGPGNHVLDGAAHWCHLVNMTEPSMCGSNVALCQITLTTCLTSINTYRHDASKFIFLW